MKSMNRWLGLPAYLLFAGWLAGQEQPNPKTLIPPATIQSMVDEVSGTLAYQHILDLAGYEHDRLEEEYKSTYREAAYIEKMAKQYGMEDVHIERFKLPNKTWDGEVGELWLVTPEKRLILSYRDIAAALATGSRSADVNGDAEALHEALNRVHQAYWRKGEAIRSAKVLAETDERAKMQIESIAKNFVDTGEPADTSLVKNYSRLVAGGEATWKPAATDEESARLIPVHKPTPAAADAAGRGGAGGGGGGSGGAGGGGGRGGAGGALAGFYAQEARQFADGKRSVLEIRDAISAEFGPVDSGKVLEFFTGPAAAFELKPK